MHISKKQIGEACHNQYRRANTDIMSLVSPAKLLSNGYPSVGQRASWWLQVSRRCPLYPTGALTRAWPCKHCRLSRSAASCSHPARLRPWTALRRSCAWSFPSPWRTRTSSLLLRFYHARTLAQSASASQRHACTHLYMQYHWPSASYDQRSGPLRRVLLPCLGGVRARMDSCWWLFTPFTGTGVGWSAAGGAGRAGAEQQLQDAQ